MKNGEKSLARLIEAAGAESYGFLDAADLRVDPAFRALCAQNSCGRFGSSWAGPPALGSPERLRAELSRYSRAAVLRILSPSGLFDYEGMMAGAARLDLILRALRSAMLKSGLWRKGGFLILGAGCCKLCGECSYPDYPCEHPEEAIAPVEGYCIDARDTAEKAGLAYDGGEDASAFFGLVLF